MFNKLFKSFFAVAMTMGLTLGFVACEPDEPEQNGNPSVELSKTALNFNQEEGSQSVDVAANCDWKVKVEYTTGEDWITVTPMSGNGNSKITVSVPMNDTDAIREATIKVVGMHPTYGEWETKKIAVKQSATEDAPVEEVALYYDNFDGKEAKKEYGEEGDKYPYLDQFPDFANAKGSAAANVTYTGSGISIRSNSTSDSSYSDYTGSGLNNIFFGSSAQFVINGLALESTQNNLRLTFGSEKYVKDADSHFSTAEFKVYLSKDGLAWAPIEFTFAGTEPGRWNLATADFTLTEVPETLYIKFTASVASAYRLDDVKLVTGNGGQSVTLPDEVVLPEMQEVTVAEFLDAAEDDTIYKLTGVITNAANNKYGNFDLKDDTGSVYVYGLLTPEGESQKQWEAAGLKNGDIITVYGTRTSFNDKPQMKNATYVSHEVGEEPEPTPQVGPYVSDAAFICSADDSTNCVYTLGATMIGEYPVSGFKLGKSKQEGKFTSAAVGVTGDKYLNFYGAAWKDTSASIYFRVDGGATQTIALAGNASVSGTIPFAALSFADTDLYSVKLEGLTATSTIEFSTNADFALTAHNSNAPRVILCGVKLTDEALSGNTTPNPEPEPEPEPKPEPEPEVETLVQLDNNAYYTFKPATEMKGGKWYAIVADTHAATALAKNYGYLQITETFELAEGVALPANCAFGFLTTEGGYTVQQYDGKYLYQTGTYDSFNVQDTLPTDGGVWTVSVDGDKFTINNSSVNKFVQYDATYNSYGSYATAKGTLPTLYELVEVCNENFIVSVSDDALVFAANGGTNEVEVVTNGSATLAATADANWISTSVSGNAVSITAEANEVAEAREATVTITYGNTSKTVAVSQAAAGQVNEFVITFPGNPSSYTNAYDKSFTITLDSAYEFEFGAINNGQETNAWTAVRFGRKSNASVATVVSKSAIPYAVSSVKVNFTQVDTEMNSQKLIVARDAEFTDVVEEVTAQLMVGEVAYNVTTPEEGLYYKLVYDMPSTGTNGSYRFDKVTYAK